MSNTFYYEKEYETYFHRTVNIDPSCFLAPFADRLPENACVWDIGCGSGRDLLWLKKKGVHVTGLEISPGLARLAEEHSKCPVVLGDFESFDFSLIKADGILLIGVLVHVAWNRFAAVLQRISKALKKNGLLYISLKQGDGTVKDSEGRVFYLWQDEALRNIFNDLGFELIAFSKNTSAIKTGETWLGYLLLNIGLDMGSALNSNASNLL